MELWPKNPLGERYAGPRPKGTPPAFWNRAALVRAICLGVNFAAVVPAVLIMLIYVPQGRMTPFLGLFPPVLGLSALTLYAIVPRVMQRRFRSRLAANEGLLCLQCGYALVGLPEAHLCPECGHAYNADETRTAWTNWLRTGDMRKAE